MGYSRDDLDAQAVSAALHISEQTSEANREALRSRASELGSAIVTAKHPALIPGCRRSFVMGEREASDGASIYALGDGVGGLVAFKAYDVARRPIDYGSTMYFWRGNVAAGSIVLTGATSVIAVGPLGVLGAQDLTDDDPAVAEYATTPAGVYGPVLTPVLGHLWIKKNAAPTCFPEIQLGFGGVWNTHAFVLDPATGAAQVRVGSFQSIRVYEARPDWWHVTFKHGGSLVGADVAMRIYPAAGTTYPTVAASAVGTTTYYEPQLHLPSPLMLSEIDLYGENARTEMYACGYFRIDGNSQYVGGDVLHSESGATITITHDPVSARIVATVGGVELVAPNTTGFLHQAVWFEIEMLGGDVTFRAGPAGVVSEGGAVWPEGDSTNAWLGGPFSVNAELGSLAFFDTVPTAAEKRAMRAWAMDRFALNSNAFAEW